MSMNFEELSDSLRSNHLYPIVLIKGGKEIGLEVYCPPIQKDSRLEAVRNVIGEGFRADFIGNGNDYILIKKI